MRGPDLHGQRFGHHASVGGIETLAAEMGGLGSDRHAKGVGAAEIGRARGDADSFGNRSVLRRHGVDRETWSRSSLRA